LKTVSPDACWASPQATRSVEAALWAFFHTDTFRDGALMVVNLGEDAEPKPINCVN